MVRDTIIAIIGTLVMAAIMVLIGGAVIMGLWNWLMPAIFGISQITFLQACGIMLLAHLLIATPIRYLEKQGDYYDRSNSTDIDSSQNARRRYV